MDRHLGLAAATTLVVGQVIAVGIFLTPAAMARLLGSPFWLLVVWVVAGAMALCGTLVYAELAARGANVISRRRITITACGTLTFLTLMATTIRSESHPRHERCHY